MKDNDDCSNPPPFMPIITGVPVKICRWAKVKVALSYSGWGRTKLYQLIGTGKIEAIKDGGTTLVCLDSIDRYRELLPALKLKRAG